MDYDLEFEPPVVNLKMENLKAGSSSWTETCKFVRESMEKYGFFVAIHDEFSGEMNDKVFLELKGLFDLPFEVKTQYKTEFPFVNYIGRNTYSTLSESIGFDAAKDIEKYESFANLMWPSGNQNFCETLHSYVSKLAELNALVTRMIFESYGVEKYFESHQESLSCKLWLNKYNAPEEGERTIGAPTHSDKSFTTVLTQGGVVDALDVELRNGKWIHLHFPPSSAVIMAGDTLRAWSNGRVRSAPHQVVMKGMEPRYSLAQFAFVDTKLEAPKEFLDDEHPQLYHPVTSMELLSFYQTEEGYRAHDILEAYCGV